MHSELDMVTKAEDSIARFREAINERLNNAYQMLYAEFVGCWMKSPTSLVQTPGFAENGQTVAWVVSDHFAGKTVMQTRSKCFRSSLMSPAARTPKNAPWPSSTASLVLMPSSMLKTRFEARHEPLRRTRSRELLHDPRD